MLHYSIVFFIIAIIAAVLGFGGIAGSAAGIAKILFAGFLILSVISLILAGRNNTCRPIRLYQATIPLNRPSEKSG